MSLFITLEGPDGSGKTTVSLRIVEQLKKEAIDGCIEIEVNYENE